MITDYAGSRLLGAVREIKAIRVERNVACTVNDPEHCAPIDESSPNNSPQKINKKPLYVRLLITLLAFAIGVYFLIAGEAMPGAILISTVCGFWLR